MGVGGVVVESGKGSRSGGGWGWGGGVENVPNCWFWVENIGGWWARWRKVEVREWMREKKNKGMVVWACGEGIGGDEDGKVEVGKSCRGSPPSQSPPPPTLSVSLTLPFLSGAVGSVRE